MTQYKCIKCNNTLDATEDNFFPSYLKLAKEKNKTTIPKCKSCAISYSASWRQNIKDKSLIRSQQKTLSMAKAVRGTIYVIGTDVPGTPFKIGVTTGTDTSKRKTALQTAHWLNLELVWKSELLERADKIERKIHKYFDKHRVRGEWFNIDKKDIELIPELIKQYINEI